jgi:prophage regulatory protein
MAIMRIREVMEMVGIGRATIYRLLSRGDFPKPLKLGERSIGWREDEIQSWIEGRDRA